MKFKICIEETLSQEFDVDAESGEEAMSIAKHRYAEGEFVIEANNVTSRSMAVMSPNDEATGFVQF